MKLRWTSTALSDLSTMHVYILAHRPESVEDVALEILECVDALAKNYMLGRASRTPGIREFAIEKHPYFIPYQIRNQDIYILRVLHDKRNLPEV
ncbi:MAG: type II toxin-antitoxin system RelE/ParE family toxin [Taibaiella sp.]|nr:type II toxin-antitoxin system RelE/ParE family toxin [Taibaiella sp.]